MNEEGIKVSARPILVLTCFLGEISGTNKPASIAVLKVNIEHVIGETLVDMSEKVVHNEVFRMLHPKRGRGQHLH